MFIMQMSNEQMPLGIKSLDQHFFDPTCWRFHDRLVVLGHLVDEEEEHVPEIFFGAVQEGLVTKLQNFLIRH
jgi:hypothetical protein